MLFMFDSLTALLLILNTESWNWYLYIFMNKNTIIIQLCLLLFPLYVSQSHILLETSKIFHFNVCVCVCVCFPNPAMMAALIDDLPNILGQNYDMMEIRNEMVVRH